jgi:uncharacterized membrane protein
MDSNPTPTAPQGTTPKVAQAELPLLAIGAYFPVVFLATVFMKGKDSFYMWHAKMGAVTTLLFFLPFFLTPITPLSLFFIWRIYQLAWFVLIGYLAFKAWKHQTVTLPVLSSLAHAIPLEKLVKGSAPSAASANVQAEVIATPAEPTAPAPSLDNMSEAPVEPPVENAPAPVQTTNEMPTEAPAAPQEVVEKAVPESESAAPVAANVAARKETSASPDLEVKTPEASVDTPVAVEAQTQEVATPSSTPETPVSEVPAVEASSSAEEVAVQAPASVEIPTAPAVPSPTPEAISPDAGASDIQITPAPTETGSDNTL